MFQFDHGFLISEEFPRLKLKTGFFCGEIMNYTLRLHLMSILSGALAIAAVPAVSAKSSSPSKAEKTRQARLEQEIKNEDLLQQRLEELRLKDEQRRTEQVLRATRDEPVRKATPDQGRVQAPSMNTSSSQAPMQTAESVEPARPVILEDSETDDSYQMSKAPLTAQPAYVRQGSDVLSTSRSSVSDLATTPENGSSEAGLADARRNEAKEKSGIYVAPRAGLPVLSSNQYNFVPKYLVGVGVGFELSERFTFDLGFNYSQVGVSLGQNLANQFGNPSNRLTYKQTAFDMTSRWIALGKEYKFRPFIGGGVGYGMGSINYDQTGNTLPTAFQNNQDYQLRTFQGILLTGADYWITPTISLQLSYRYIRTLSATEREGINNNGFFSTYDPNKANIRGSIRTAAAHQVGAGFQFLF